LFGGYDMEDNYDDVFTIGDVAEYLKISRSSAYQLAKKGELPGRKVGKHWRFHRHSIEQWLIGGFNDQDCYGKHSNMGND